jgi:tRNA (guanine-N7-)-methyltransferase
MTNEGQHDKPLPVGSVESEFGVPIPGKILPPEQWTVSALRQWPEGFVDFEQIFGRRAPVVLDIGCGNGRSTLVSAFGNPEWDHLGIDNLPVVIRYARKRARQRGLGNVRFAVGDARVVLPRHIPPASVAQVHVYNPQPYYDPRKVALRLITPQFLLDVHRVLIPGGLLVMQSDNPAYWKYILQVAPAFFDFHEHKGNWPDAPQGRSRREIIDHIKHLPVFRGMGYARTDVDVNQAKEVAAALPEPVFDADRALMEVDEMEARSGGRKDSTAHPKHRRGRKGGRWHYPEKHG